MAVKQRLVIEFKRPSLGDGNTAVNIQRMEVQRLRKPSGALHRAKHFHENRLVGDVPSLKRIIYERHYDSNLGKGLHMAAKSGYRMATAPGKAAFNAGLAAENVGNFAGKLARRKALFALQDKLRGDDDINRFTEKGATFLIGGVMLARDCVAMRRERQKLLNKTLPESKKHLQQARENLLNIQNSRLRQTGSKLTLKNADFKIEQLRLRFAQESFMYAKRIDRLNQKAFRATHLSYTATRLGNLTGGLTEKSVTLFAKAIFYKHGIDATEFGNITGKIAGKAVGGTTFLTVLGLKRIGITLGRTAEDKLRQVASENDSLAAINAGVQGVRYVTGTYRQPFYNNVRKRRFYKAQRNVSKLQQKSSTAANKLKKSISKLSSEKKNIKTSTSTKTNVVVSKNKTSTVVNAIKNPKTIPKVVVKKITSKIAREIMTSVIQPILPYLIAIIIILLVIIFIVIAITSFINLSEDLLTTYPTDGDDITATSVLYTRWETDLKMYINNIEYSYPDYDEYKYNIGRIRHDPLVLIAFLNAQYGEFTAESITPELRELFLMQYSLSLVEEVQGNRRILYVTLVSQPLADVVAELMDDEQNAFYNFYLEYGGNLRFVGSPIDGDWLADVTDLFGYRVHPITGEINHHTGLDIRMPVGSELLAVHGGVVTARYDDEGTYGNYIIVENDDGLRSLYAHCDSLLFTDGQTVNTGDVIALSGNSGRSTGAHLHFELRKDGVLLNPIFFMNNKVEEYYET